MKKLAIVICFISATAFGAPEQDLSPQAREIHRKRFDELSAKLPTGINAKDVIGLIAPGRDATMAIRLEVRPWNYRANTYIAYASFSPDKYEPLGHGEEPSYLGVIEYVTLSSGIKLIARTAGPADLVASIADIQERYYGGITKLDLAPYKISDKEVAFGIRFSMHTGYAGGASETEYLALFRIEDDKVTNILTEPMSFRSDLAGDWHDDGTRDRSSNESYFVLSVLKHSTQGYYDLKINEKNGHSKTIFVWSSQAKKYLKQAKEKPPNKPLEPTR